MKPGAKLRTASTTAVGAGDISAHDAESLAEGALDDVDPVHHPFALGDAAAARAVHADRMDLIEIGHCAVAPCEVADGADRRDIAVHRIDALEHNQFGPVAGSLEQLFEVSEIVVAEDHLVAARLPHALDHRVVIERIGDDQASGDEPGNRRMPVWFET